MTEACSAPKVCETLGPQEQLEDDMSKALVMACALALAAFPSFGAQKHKSPKKKAGVSVLGTKQKDCLDSDTCNVGVSGIAPADADTTCTVSYEFSAIVVGQGKTPKVVWTVSRADPADRSEYRFAVNGIALNAKNDPAKDFKDGGFDGTNKKKYKWKSVNKAPSVIPYEINVVRKPPGGTWPNAERCTPVDPTISNMGP
jgi:hypothetical protein